MSASMILHCNYTYENGSECGTYYSLWYVTTEEEFRAKAHKDADWSSTAGPPISDYCPSHNPYNN